MKFTTGGTKNLVHLNIFHGNSDKQREVDDVSRPILKWEAHTYIGPYTTIRQTSLRHLLLSGGLRRQ